MKSISKYAITFLLVVFYALQGSIDIPHNEKETFFDAIKKNNVNYILEKLHTNKILINIRSLYGTTPLHLAIIYGNFDIAYALLKAGADPDALDDMQNSPLYFAITKNNEPLLYLLLSYNANVNLENSARITPLHWACYCGYINIVEILLMRHALQDIPDIYGNTAYNYADLYNKKNIIALLERYKTGSPH